jgi:hypothetical protein
VWWVRHAYERHVHEKHAYERHVPERHVHERPVREMLAREGTLTGCMATINIQEPARNFASIQHFEWH